MGAVPNLDPYRVEDAFVESRDQVKRRDGGAFDKDRGVGVQVVGLASVAARPLLESPVWVGFYHELSVDFSVPVHA